MSNKSNTVIFDLADVFITGLPGVEPSISKYLNISESWTFRLLRNSNLYPMFRDEVTEDQYWNNIIQRIQSVRNNQDIRVETLKDLIRKNFVEIEGTREVIQSLKDNGYKLGLLSDHVREWIDYYRKTFNHEENFDFCLYSFDVKFSKKDNINKMLQTLLQKLDSTVDKTLYVDDMERNVVNARDNGFKVIEFHNAAQLKQELAGYGVYL